MIISDQSRWLKPFGRAWRAHPDLCSVLLLLAVAVPSRLLFLGSDPPADLQSHFFWDEGGWAHNARVHQLLGVWMVDDHNAPLVLAPLYTMILATVYSVLGLGLVPTRLVSAISGILTCLIIYWAIRSIRAPGRSLGAAMAFTLSYFVVTHHRVALTEANQLLWIAIGFAGVLWGLRDPRWVLLGGIGIALSQLVKPSALILLPVIGCFWLWRSRPAGREPGERSFPWLELAWFGTGAAIVAAPLAAIAIPNWGFVWRYLSVSLRSLGVLATEPFVNLPGDVFRLPPTGLVLQSIVQVAVVGGFAWLRLLRSRDDRPDAVERFAWLWLGIGLISLGLIRYQPDRRFLLLTVPLAILFATALGGGVPRSLSSTEPRVSVLRRLFGGAILGFAAGWVGVALGFFGMGYSRHGWTILWSLAVVGGVLLSSFLPLRVARRIAEVPAGLFIALFLLLEPARFAGHLTHPRYSTRDAARRLAAVARDLAAEDRVIVGPVAAAFAIESNILDITELNKPEVGALLNPDAWARFQPSLALESIPRGMTHAETGEALRRGFQPCMTLQVLPNTKEVRLLRFELLIRPDLVNSCETANHLESDRSSPEVSRSLAGGS